MANANQRAAMALPLKRRTSESTQASFIVKTSLTKDLEQDFPIFSTHVKKKHFFLPSMMCLERKEVFSARIWCNYMAGCGSI